MANSVFLLIILAVIGAGGGWLAGINGLFTVRLARKKDASGAQLDKEREERESFNAIVSQALSTMTFLDNQVKELRTANATENQALRERIRVLEARVTELEAENKRLRAGRRGRSDNISAIS